MKNLKFMIVALVAMLGFCACDNKCDHEFIEYDYNKALVGTWTYVEGELAEVMQIKEDGSFAVTGVMKGGSLYESKGTIKVVNNKVSLVFEGDKDATEGRLELVAGKSLSIVINEEYDIRLTYDYCDNDLSDEIVGMWVCTEEVFGQEEESVAINTFTEEGKSYLTAYMSEIDGYLNQMESDYMVIGNLLITCVKDASNMPIQYIALVLDFKSNGTELGDIMTHYNPIYKTTATFVRVKQELNLNDKTYDYISAYVTNAKGADEEFTILGNTFNIAKIEGGHLDMMFRSVLSCLELNANSFKYTLRIDGRDSEFNDPITVEGNKVTLNMSARDIALRKVEMYVFQDADDSQLHIYMPTKSFVNYFANLQIPTLIAEGKLDTTDAAAVEKVYTDMEARVESINVSLVFKLRK